MKELSVLIPTFNDECLTLVKDLLSQCNAYFASLGEGERDRYEIIVADDGSTDAHIININTAINSLPHCRFILRGKNAGRAAIRNFLACEAQFGTVLFIDSDMTVTRKKFISNYLDVFSSTEILYGGYEVPEQKGMTGNLRYRYERAWREVHTAEKRQLTPYADFHTSNFMASRQIMMYHPFDEHFRHYGYEDVVFGDELRQAGIPIRHIDNPLGFCRFESNEAFIEKTEEGLRTLAEFREQLRGYSRLLDLTEKLRRLHLAGVVRVVLKPFLPLLRRNLTGVNPSLKSFSLYKLGYLLNIGKIYRVNRS